MASDADYRAVVRFLDGLPPRVSGLLVAAAILSERAENVVPDDGSHSIYASAANWRSKYEIGERELIRAASEIAKMGEIMMRMHSWVHSINYCGERQWALDVWLDDDELRELCEVSGTILPCELREKGETST